MIKMYGIKNCDTIKKARQFLEAQGVDFEFVDFRQKGARRNCQATRGKIIRLNADKGLYQTQH
jgi:arsenate reductase-like glutaredoxin family protein